DSILNSSTIGIINITEKIPKDFKLYQNYPNPFNPVTKIGYELPVNSFVTVKIYDLLGREIVVLIDNKFKTAGIYELEWNASEFTSGIYFYTIFAGKFFDTKKMVLMK
ncbi:MAG TPA: T9SS type A sorting domain-containing protein, partial [Ignavibacteria bacterium]|nr:T9SS type A sorting domain-containing protein [Ignavibacteria bacterium]